MNDINDITRELKLRLGIGRNFRVVRGEGCDGGLVVPKKVSEEEWLSTDLAENEEGEASEGSHE